MNLRKEIYEPKNYKLRPNKKETFIYGDHNVSFFITGDEKIVATIDGKEYKDIQERTGFKFARLFLDAKFIIEKYIDLLNEEIRKEIRRTIREDFDRYNLRPEDVVEIVTILKTGDKILAVKKCRELLGSSLRDAVNIVDDLALEYGIVANTPGESINIKIYKSGVGMGNPGYSATVQSKYFAKTVHGRTGAEALKKLADAMDAAGFLE